MLYHVLSVKFQSLAFLRQICINTRRFYGQVRAEVGRVKFVFLMKFVNDLLRFLDPFINDQNVQDAAKAQAAAAQAAASAGLSSIYR